MRTIRNPYRSLIGLLIVSVSALLIVPALVFAQNIPDIKTPANPIVMDTTKTTVHGDGSISIDPRGEYSYETNLFIAQSLKAVPINRDIAENAVEQAEKAIEKLDKAKADLAAEERALIAVKGDPAATAEKLAAAEKRVADAGTFAEAAETAANIAAGAAMGVDAGTVESMRDSGLSWAEICEEIGVSSSVLGSAVDNESEQGLTEGGLASFFAGIKASLNSSKNNKGKGNEGNGGTNNGNSGGSNGNGNGNSNGNSGNNGNNCGGRGRH